MSSLIGEATVRIRPDTRQFRAETERGVKGSIAGIGRNLRTAAGVGLGLGAGFEVFKFFEEGIKGAAAEERALHSLKQVVDSVGASYRVHGKNLGVLLGSMEEATGTDLPTLSQAFTRLEVQTKNTARSYKDLKLAQDIAVARHIDVAQAAVFLARAEGGTFTALRRLGIIIPPITAAQDALAKKHTSSANSVAQFNRRVEEARAGGIKFNAQQTAQLGLFRAQLRSRTEVTQADKDQAKALDTAATKQQVFAQLQARFGGQTRVFARSTAGEYARLREGIHNLAEEIGSALLPGLGKGAEGLHHEVDALKDSKTFTDALHGSVSTLGDVFGVLGNVIRTVGPPILTVVQGIAAGVQAVGAGPILAAVAAYKGLALALTTIQGAQARYTALIAAGQASQAGSTAQTAKAATAEEAYTASLIENTAALRTNAAALSTQLRFALGTTTTSVSTLTRETQIATGVGGIGGIGGAAKNAGREAEVAGGKFKALGRGIIGAIGGRTLILGALAGIAGGLTFLLTRESELEHQNRVLKGSFELLASGLNRLTSLTQRLGDAEAAIPTDRLAVQTAKLAVEHARANLENSKAAKGSLARRDLENQLKTALDQQRLSERQLAGDRGRVAALHKGTTRQEVANDKQRKVALDQVRKTFSDARKELEPYLSRIDSLKRHNIGAATSQERHRTALEATRRAAAGVASTLRSQADELGKQNPLLGHNTRLLAGLIEKLGHLPSKRVTNLVLDNKDPKLKLPELLRLLRGGLSNAKGIASEQGRQIGHGLGQGIEHGLDAEQGGINRSARRAVSGAAGAIRAYAGIHSASTLMAEQVGKPLGEGIAKGVDASQTQIKTAVTGGVRGGFQGVGELILREQARLVRELLSELRGTLNTAKGVAGTEGSKVGRHLGESFNRGLNASATIGAGALRVPLRVIRQVREAAAQAEKAVQGIHATPLPGAFGVGPDVGPFVAKLQKFREELRVQQPLLTRNVGLLTDYAAGIGRIPKPKEQKLILQVKAPKESLAEVERLLSDAVRRAKAKAAQEGPGLTGELKRHVDRATIGARAEAQAKSPAIGAAIMDGAKAGVLARAQALADELISAVAGAVAATQGYLGAHSPSRLTAERLGRPIGEGVAAGVARSQDPIDRALAGAINRALGGAITEGFHGIGGQIVREQGKLYLRVLHAQVPIPIRRDIGNWVEKFVGQGVSRAQALDTLDWWQHHFDRIVASSKAHSQVIRQEAASAALTQLARFRAGKPIFTLPHAQGLIREGNLDLARRPIVVNPDGTVSTVRTISIGTAKGRETLIPTVSRDRVLSVEKAIELFRRTGGNFGSFSTIEAANKYAERLHRQQAKMYAREALLARRGGGAIAAALGEGLAKGIGEKASEAAAGAISAVRGMIQAVKAFAGIHSASVLMAEQVGKPLGEGVAAGIRETGPLMGDALTAGVQQAIAQSESAVAGAVNEAKQNLFSIASTLSSDVAQALDEGPLGKRIQALQRGLDRRQAAGQRKSLGGDIRDARRQLAEAQRSVTIVGEQTPAQKRAVQDFLRPFRQRLRDAQAAFRDFATTQEITSLQQREEAEKKAADRHISDLVASFNSGALTVQQFNRRLGTILSQPDIRAAYRTSGNTLGIAFKRGFDAEIAGLLAQAKLIAQAPKVAGTGQGPSLVSPLKTIEENQLSAQKDIAAEAKKHTKLLQDIAAKKATADLTGKKTTDTSSGSKGSGQGTPTRK